MAFVDVDGVRLWYEAVGDGVPLVLCHEFAGDARAWEPQVRALSRRYRVIRWNYRGYPPSDVPSDEADYDHDRLVADLLGLMDALGLERPHLCGIATGGNLVLNFGIAHPQRARSLTVCGAGAGTTDREAWLAGAAAFADALDRDGPDGMVANVANAPQRTIFADKDPRGWAEFVERMRTLDAQGAAHMMRNALMHRRPVTELGPGLTSLNLPILVVCGDQDTPAFEASRFVRDTAPFAGLAVLPMCGHTLNIEEPGSFNTLLEGFLAAVDAGRWGRWTAGGAPA